jgi:phosphatidate cytidylyltransferase
MAALRGLFFRIAIMLKQRVITALVLLALFLPALFATVSWPFMGLTLLLMMAGAWEWGRLNGVSSGLGMVGALVWGGVCATVWQTGWALQDHRALWWLAGSLWVLLGGWMVHRGVPGWAKWPVALRWPGGLVLLALAWLAMVQAHARGVNFLLSVLVLVWAADVFAYFAGRAFGGRWFPGKLAPSISPGKSWEGVVGGMVGVLLIAGLWWLADRHWAVSAPSLYSVLFLQGGFIGVLALLLLCAMSVVGDLVESLVKRSAGCKDSSGLLPGHGGVLDRVDALLPALPLAMMLVSWS